MDDIMNETSTEKFDSAEQQWVAQLLGDQPDPAMPDAVWQRLASALSVESANRAADRDCHPGVVKPVVDKNVSLIVEQHTQLRS